MVIPNTAQIAKNTVNENFTSAINTVKLNKITENYDNQFSMSVSIATDINNNCKPLGDGSLPDGCKDKVKTIYGYHPTNDTPNFNKLACPVDYPIAVNGGTQCTKQKNDGSVRLNPKDGRGIKVGDKDNTINCGKNKGDKCGNYTAKKIGIYTRKGYTLDDKNKQVRGCLIDNNMIEAGYTLDDKDLACNSEKYCIGYTHGKVTTTKDNKFLIHKNNSTLGYCSDDSSLQKNTFNFERGGDVLETVQSQSTDYCYTECKNNKDCVAHNYNQDTNECKLLRNATTLNPSRGTITSLRIDDYNKEGQKMCEDQIKKNVSNATDLKYIGNNNDANTLFKTTGLKGGNLVQFPNKKAYLRPGSVASNNFVCVKSPQGWNNGS